MSVSRIKFYSAALIVAGLPSVVFAQTPAPSSSSAGRDASFIADPAGPAAADFSGLAAPVAETQPAPAPTASPLPAVTPAVSTPAPMPASAAPDAKIDILGAPVDMATLPDVSPESIGMPGSGIFGADMWKGTSRAMADNLLTIARPTLSPVLNDLARKVLKIAAVPPEGRPVAEQSMAGQRIVKLLQFGDAPAAWALAQHADPKLLDDAAIHDAAALNLTGNGDDVCNALPALETARPGIDWQKENLVCQLRARDIKAAQVTLDLLRAQTRRDDMFLAVADKFLQDQLRSLPSQLTPLSPDMLALLQLTRLPLSGDLYGHPDSALIPALLRLPAKQDVAQMGLAERAVSRGIIDGATLAAIYRGITFAPDEIATPLAAAESGSRLRALLYQAATSEKNDANRIAYAEKFLNSAPPELVNGVGPLLSDMLGDIEPDAARKDSAVMLARFYMIAGQGNLALGWLRIARQNPGAAADILNLWPQLTLAGLETETDYAGDLDRWLDAGLTGANPQADPQAHDNAARDNATAALLLLDAAGFAVPDAAWARLTGAGRTDKKIAFSPLLSTRLHDAAAAGRKAETVLFAVAMAGEGEIPLPTAIAVTRALHMIGLKSEAATFARHMLALQTKTN